MKRTNAMHKIMALFICAVMILGILPISVLAAGDTLLIAPISVELTDANGVAFTDGQEVTPGEEFNACYQYGTLAAGSIDTTVKYALPTLSNHLEVAHSASGENVIVTGNGAVLPTPFP